MKRLITSVNEQEYKEIIQFCEDNGITPYGLLKLALFEYLENRLGQDIRSPAEWKTAESRLSEAIRVCKEKDIDLGAVITSLAKDQAKSGDHKPGKKVKD